MADPFPITIDGHTWRSAKDLAADIAERGDKCILPDRGVGHPDAYYKRWMSADASGATKEAVLAASALLIDSTASGDAFDHAVQLTGSDGTEQTVRRLLDRIEGEDVPDSQWFGSGAEIAGRSLSAVSHGIQTRMLEERGRLARLMERYRKSFEAAYLYLRGTAPDVEAAAIVKRWAEREGLPAQEVSALTRTTLRHPTFVVPMAKAVAGANAEAREAFQAEVDRRAPERSAEVAAVLAQGKA